MAIRAEPGRTSSRRVGAIAGGWTAVLALFVVALNQRPAVASIGPLLDDIRHGLHLSGTAAAVLTAAPVICFGALAPLGGWLSHRLGMNRSVAVLSGLLLVGLVVRIGPDTATLFLGTVLAAAGIAAMNVVLPALVRLRWPQQTGLMMGVYTTGVTGAAALAAGLTVPIEHELGGGWRGGLAPWAVLGAAGVLGWLSQLRRPQLRRSDCGPSGYAEKPVRAAPRRSDPSVRLHRDRLAWLVTGYFAIQSAGFYAVLTW